jgi:ribose-phosphate pyrophosphokinase
MELLLMIDAAKRASAHSVIAVMPYFGWARQDRKDKPRVSIAAKLVADLLTTAGADRIITMDLHADQIQGFFNIPVDHLYASSVFIPYIQSLGLDDLVLGSPDAGGAKRVNSYAKYLGVPYVLCHKQRAKANVVAQMTIIGDVKDKNVIIIDDMVDTAGTITKAADLMMEHGAKSVRALASHAIMSDPASQRVTDSGLTEIIFSNSIPFNKDCKKVTILSVAHLFADTIRRVHGNESISSQYLIK